MCVLLNLFVIASHSIKACMF